MGLVTIDSSVYNPHCKAAADIQQAADVFYSKSVACIVCYLGRALLLHRFPEKLELMH